MDLRERRTLQLSGYREPVRDHVDDVPSPDPAQPTHSPALYARGLGRRSDDAATERSDLYALRAQLDGSATHGECRNEYFIRAHIYA